MILHRITLRTGGLLQAQMSSRDLWEDAAAMRRLSLPCHCPRSHSGCSGIVISQEDETAWNSIEFSGDFPGLLSVLLRQSTSFYVHFGSCKSQNGSGRNTQDDALNSQTPLQREGEPHLGNFQRCNSPHGDNFLSQHCYTGTKAEAG